MNTLKFKFIGCRTLLLVMFGILTFNLMAQEKRC